MNARFRWILPALMLGLAACQPRAGADGADGADGAGGSRNATT